jgi:hypothetical protein
MTPSNLTGLWREETLCEYFAHVRTLKPVITENSQKILSATYLYLRSDPHTRPERKTVRLLESLIRYNRRTSLLLTTVLYFIFYDIYRFCIDSNIIITDNSNL